MVNTSEPSINVVILNRLKMLTSLNQKVRSIGMELVGCSIMGTKSYRRTEGTLPIPVTLTKHGKPAWLPIGG